MEAGDKEDRRFLWIRESPRALKRHMCDDHGAFLLEPFQAEARELYSLPDADIQSLIARAGEREEKDLLMLLLEVRGLAPEVGDSTTTKLKRRIVSSYNRIALGSAGDDDTSKLWLIKHNLSSARDLLGVLKDAGDSTLEVEGFRMVQDDRRSGCVSMRHLNLSKLLDWSGWCRMKFDTSSFGVSLRPPIGVSYERGVPFFLRRFMVLTLALDFAIDRLMEALVGGEPIADVFREALFYSVPSRHPILYDQDLDLDGHVDTERLGFRSGESLVDGRASYLRVECRDDYNEDVVEVYNFQDSEMEHILKGDCKIAHSLPLVDDGFGLCVHVWMQGVERPVGGLLWVIHGVTRGAILSSMFGTRTSIHVEESMLATFNLLVLGAPKIWYIVANEHGACFRAFLKKKRLLKAVFEKRCFVEAFSSGRALTLTQAEMETYRVRRIVQYPGMTVMTIPGLIFHWTISMGFSLADSVNYYCDFKKGMTLVQLEELWNSYKADAGNPDSLPSTTSSLYFEMLKTFNIF